MQKKLFHDGWTFLLQPVGSTPDSVLGKKEQFSKVNIPHDWQIYQGKKLYEDGTGWYRKQFACSKKENTRYEIYFEGVYMDTCVYVNGKEVGQWKYGYSSFFFDLTPYLTDGENELLVSVTVQHPNSRWYSGAGIYRNVYWIEYPQCHFQTDSLYIVPRKKTEKEWQVSVQAQLAGLETKNGQLHDQYDLVLSIMDAEGKVIAIQTQNELSMEEDTVSITTTVSEPKLWDLDTPYLYLSKLALVKQGIEVDAVEEKTGFRTFTCSAKEGLFLNGKHIKLNGVCEHHDFGAIGAAFYKTAMRRKLEILREMGVNSIRSTHNMPAVGLLELADEMGFIVVDEAFDMWERPKTTYDYARFFKEWYQKDVKSWICRDRNHPCILFWSIGNEIYDTHADERGLEVTKALAEEVRKYDPQQNAFVTIGSNFMPWENAQKCADVVKFAGYNYGEKYYQAHHQEHPDWFIYGSETGSTVQSRGIYHFPYEQPVLADDDEQCSSLGNSTTSWGAKSSEYCIITERDTPFSMGQFLWTGFDYIGEPTPYHTRNSYFGQIDTAGFPKDAFYVYQSAWTSVEKNPMIHIFPYWDFNPEQEIDIRVATNAPFAALFVNGKSQGMQEIDHAHGMVLTANWKLPYEAGEVTAIAYDREQNEVARETIHSFGNAKQLKITQYKPERELVAGAYDLAYFTITVLDKDGYPVENANDMVQVQVEGAGWLTGLDNGDSTDTDEYKGYKRRLFVGKLLAIVAVGEKTGEIRVTASGEGLQSATICCEVKKRVQIEGVSLIPEQFASETAEQDSEQRWIRKLTLTSETGNVFSPSCMEKQIKVVIDPPEASSCLQEELIWKVVNDAGVESSLAKVESAPEGAKVTAVGDGKFRLRCMSKNGQRTVKIISQISFEVKDVGEAFLNPYQFIAGVLYSYAEGEVGNGNEHGAASARDGRTVIGFEKVDFGEFGSDTITLPIFELGGDPCPIQIWEGIPQQAGSELLTSVVYHKPSIWNEYQAETYQLKKRVKGVKTICFVLNQKIHLKGFSFAKQEKSYARLYAAENDAIYGDQFQMEEQMVSDIGNNVTMEFTKMHFINGMQAITICGKTRNDHNTIHVRFTDEETGEESRQIIEFPKSEELTTITFPLHNLQGKVTVRFVFLPGSQFDFSWFQFIEQQQV